MTAHLHGEHREAPAPRAGDPAGSVTVQSGDPDRAAPAMPAGLPWTRESVRALGPTTDLPTAGAIFGVSRWKAYQMRRQGQWDQLGVTVILVGGRYRVAVHSILTVLGSRLPAGRPAAPGEQAAAAGAAGRHRRRFPDTTRRSWSIRLVLSAAEHADISAAASRQGLSRGRFAAEAALAVARGAAVTPEELLRQELQPGCQIAMGITGAAQ